ncbi:ABC-2 family transporter protein [Roseimaritima multifibrata]|uniref:ABC-2 family transporter protein n=1 Tax=Roseimaritima multifibrata TaxID=1930274 RepID=A0A517MF03_9BACT|nr:ABC transporter permease [Roseimaritima multifibrata]QDS93462.1 ABC-2 family transporter protein [Roseimaritima multifibrata]
MITEWRERLLRWEASCERLGDSLNPILVKETRQSLKSRQFLVTFSLLLLASFGWSVVGSMMLMPGLYYRPSAAPMLVGYYLLLAVPMLFVVPVAAYRSLAVEIDDGTLELLRVTTLSPMQIVMGKFCSALLQMMLYFIVLIPCVAYAYALRGIDFPTLAVLLSLVLLAAIQLTIFGLFLAPVPSGRTGQLTALFALVGVLLVAEYLIGTQAIALIQQANAMSTWVRAFLSFSGVAIVASTSYVFMTASAALLAPACSNRSTRVRAALLIQLTVVLGLFGYVVVENLQFATSNQGLLGLGSVIFMILPWVGVGYAVYWALLGSMMASESGDLTPRVRRGLPASFLGRLFLTLFIPGPVTGLLFAATGAAIAMLFVSGGLYYLRPAGSPLQDVVANVSLAVFGYLVLLLTLVRWSAGALRRYAVFRPAVGLALLSIIALLCCIIPYGIYMVWADYPSRPTYSKWQLANWLWTIQQIGNGRRDLHWIVFSGGVFCLLAQAAFLGRGTLTQVLPIPERVRVEQQRTADDED